MFKGGQEKGVHSSSSYSYVVLTASGSRALLALPSKRYIRRGGLLHRESPCLVEPAYDSVRGSIFARGRQLESSLGGIGVAHRAAPRRNRQHGADLLNVDRVPGPPVISREFSIFHRSKRTVPTAGEKTFH